MMQRVRPRAVAILILLAIAGVIAWVWPRPPARGGDILRVIQEPIASASVRAAVWFRGFTRVLRDPARVGVLEGELADLRTQHAALQRQFLEDDEARRMLARTRDDVTPAILARVVAASFRPTSHTLVVAHADDQRVRAGDVVLARGALVGVVATVGRTRSTVQLLTDPGMRIGVELAAVAGTIGVLEPDAGGGLSVSRIPIDRSVRAGDAIVTDATTNDLPRGIPIGVVSAIAADPDGFFQTAAIDPIVNPRGALVVTIRASRGE